MKPNHYDFIDALRGYAILGVLIVHVASALPPTDGIMMRLFEQGARGVQLFYVASAVTLLMSWHSRSDGFIPFCTRRLFRIAPLFWFAIPFYLAFSGFGAGYFAPESDWSKYDVFRQLFFVDSLLPSNGSIVPGGWTVNTEMLFYLLFPAFVMFIRSWYAGIIAYCISLVFVVILSPLFFDFLAGTFQDIPEQMIAVWATLSLAMQLPIFFAGFSVFYLLREKSIFPEEKKAALWGMLIFAICLMIWFSFSPPWAYGFWGIPLGLTVFVFGRGVGGSLINPAIVFLGKISFSAYIWHFMVLNFVYLDRDLGFNLFGLGLEASYIRFFGLLVFVLLITSIISFISYRFIEQPMIRVGGVFIEKWPQITKK